MAERGQQNSLLVRIIIVLVIALIEFVLLSAVVTKSWSETVRAREATWIADQLEPKAAEHILIRAQSWYDTLFLKTGIVDWSYRIFTPTPEDQARNPELKKLDDMIAWDWVHNRLEVVWMSVYTALQRTAILFAWWPLAIIVLIAGVGDGLLRRKIRQSSFAYASPLLHTAALGAIVWIGIITGIAILLPVPIPPVSVPVLLLIIGALASVMTANTQKRI